MKSIKSDVCSPAKQFPRLMVSNTTGNVYLLTDKSTGLCIHKGKNHITNFAKLGRVSEDLVVSNLKDYNGTITLAND